MSTTLKKLFSSYRTNGLYMILTAQALKSAGINVGVDQLGTDLDTIATAAGILMQAGGVIRDYVRKFRKPVTEKK